MAKKVLIVDDSQTIRKIIRTNLERMQIKDILEASDGENAIRTLNANSNIDLMFIDFNMPIMNGLNAVKKIREKEAFKELKIIVVSSSFDAALVQSFEEQGVCGFITKPFDLQKFNSTLAKVLEMAEGGIKGNEKEKGVPKEDLLRLFGSEKPEVKFDGKSVEFEFSTERIKLDIDTISKYGSVYMELSE